MTAKACVPPEPFRVAAGRGCRKDPMPVGTVVIRRDGRWANRYVKVRMDGPPARRWVLWSRWWWERNRGAVPAGKLVLHRDGDTLNDAPANLLLGGPGDKLRLRHDRDARWSRDQHARAAAGCAEWNRKKGRANRRRRFLASWWYPAVEALGAVLNVPFRRRKRLLAVFGADVSRYPANGHGARPRSEVVRVLASSPVAPVRGSELGLPRYRTYAVLEPETGRAAGPMSMPPERLIAQLERMGLWTPAVKAALRDLEERK